MQWAHGKGIFLFEKMANLEIFHAHMKSLGILFSKKHGKFWKFVDRHMENLGDFFFEKYGKTRNLQWAYGKIGRFLL